MTAVDYNFSRLNEISKLSSLISPSKSWLSRKITIEKDFKEFLKGLLRKVSAFIHKIGYAFTHQGQYFSEEVMLKIIYWHLCDLEKRKKSIQSLDKTFGEMRAALYYVNGEVELVKKITAKIDELSKALLFSEKHSSQVEISKVEEKLEAEAQVVEKGGLKKDQIAQKKGVKRNQTALYLKFEQALQKKIVQIWETEEQEEIAKLDALIVATKLKIQEEAGQKKETFIAIQSKENLSRSLQSFLSSANVEENPEGSQAACSKEEIEFFWHSLKDLNDYAMGFLQAGKDALQETKEFLLERMKAKKVPRNLREGLSDYIENKGAEIERFLGDRQDAVAKMITEEFNGKTIAHGCTHKEMSQLKKTLRLLTLEIEVEIESFCDQFKKRAEDLVEEQEAVGLESVDEKLLESGLDFSEDDHLSLELSNSYFFLESSLIGDNWTDVITGDTCKIGAGLDNFNIEALKAEVRARFNHHRLVRIHQHRLWTHRQSSEALKFSASDPHFSTFEGVGPAYSSAAPRNRTLREAVLPNFLKTTYEPCQPEKSPIFEKFSATRSATPSEFDQKNKKLRQEIAEKLVLQALMYHAKDYVEENPHLTHEITVPIQWVALLTDSSAIHYANTFAKWIGMDIEWINDSKNETQLLMDTYRALIKWGETPVAFEGKTIKFDIQLWNAPCNFIHEVLCKGLSRHPGSLEKICNQDGEVKLSSHVKKVVEETDQKLEKVKKQSSKELKPIFALMQKKGDLRAKLLENPADLKIREEFSKAANKLASIIHDSREVKIANKKIIESFKLIEHRECLLDLHLDIQSILRHNLVGNLEALDHNLYAFSARLIAIGNLLGYKIHFGCRSGKDRTGFADIEAKLIKQVVERLGRAPLFWEQERLPFIDEYRDILMKKSLNFDEVIEANLGANLGANIENCFSIPRYEGKYTEEEFQAKIAFFQEITGAAKDVFERPK